MSAAKNIIQSTSLKTPIKSGSNLTAQSAIQCQVSDVHVQALNSILHVIANGNSTRYLERVLADLMLSGGLRVSEVLSMSQLRVNALGQVFIFGCKGSNSKLVTPIYFKSFWTSRIGTIYNPFMHISRFSFYKWLVYNNISLQTSPGTNAKVTHAFRHLHVYLMQIMAVDNKHLSEVIGHKSLSNIQYYIHGGKKRV